MADIVLLNNIDHADLRVAKGYGAAFGDAVNQTTAFPTEFEALQREYPILFRRDPGAAPQAVVLLGLERDENLFLDGDRWDARYVPAAHRRGPFSIGVQSGRDGARDPCINIDLASPRLGAEGEAVFKRHGGATPYLEGVQDALSVIYEGLQTIGSIVETFEALGLIEPVAIDITVGEGLTYKLGDFHVVSRERLAALDGPALERLNREGWLALAVHAAASLGNIQTLIDRKNRKEGWA